MPALKIINEHDGIKIKKLTIDVWTLNGDPFLPEYLYSINIAHTININVIKADNSEISSLFTKTPLYDNTLRLKSSII